MWRARARIYNRCLYKKSEAAHMRSLTLLICGILLFHTFYNLVSVACNHKLLVGGDKQYLNL